MQIYEIFWIKDEFARHYFYKIDLLNRFFKSIQLNACNNLLIRQFKEITQVFDINELKKHILSHVRENQHIQVKDSQIQIYENEKKLTLDMRKNKMRLLCQTLNEAETLLFPLLRSLHPFLFVSGCNMNQYGWISPYTG